MNTESLKLEYIDQYKKIRETNKSVFPGRSLTCHNNIQQIKLLIDETNSKTILDYGCGGGEQYTELNSHKEWGIDMPSLYDPAEKEYSTFPLPPSMVIISPSLIITSPALNCFNS